MEPDRLGCVRAGGYDLLGFERGVVGYALYDAVVSACFGDAGFAGWVCESCHCGRGDEDWEGARGSAEGCGGVDVLYIAEDSGAEEELSVGCVVVGFGG